jgi:hypothetical protein
VVDKQGSLRHGADPSLKTGMDAAVEFVGVDPDRAAIAEVALVATH